MSDAWEAKLISKVDARIIAATNQNLEQLVRERKFRNDLYYRLNVLVIEMPPLRNRTSDITILANELLIQLAHEMDLKQVPRLGPEALSDMERYDWPGNVRELRNVLERSLLESHDKKVISKVALAKKRIDPMSRNMTTADTDSVFQVDFPEKRLSLKKALNDLTRSLLEEALKRGATKKRNR